MEQKTADENVGCNNDLLQPDVEISLQKAVTKIINMSDEDLEKFEDVHVKLGWIPEIEIVFNTRR